MQEKLYYLPLSLPIEFIDISPDTCNTELEVKTQQGIKTEGRKNGRIDETRRDVKTKEWKTRRTKECKNGK